MLSESTEPSESTTESLHDKMQEAMEEMHAMDAIGGGITSFATGVADLAGAAERINLVYGRGSSQRLGLDKAPFDPEHAWVMVKNAHMGCALTREEWQAQLEEAGEKAYVGMRTITDDQGITGKAEVRGTVKVYRCTSPINPYLAPVLNSWFVTPFF